MPRLLTSSTNPSMIAFDFWVNSHCPRFSQVPSVSISPCRSAHLWVIDPLKYASGMCLFPKAPVAFSFDLKTFVRPLTPISIPNDPALSLWPYHLQICPSASTFRIISSRSSSLHVTNALLADPSPSHTPNVYGSTGRSCAGYCTAPFMGTLYRYSTPLPSGLILRKSSSISEVVTSYHPSRFSRSYRRVLLVPIFFRRAVLRLRFVCTVHI